MLHVIQNDPEVPLGSLEEVVTIPHVVHRLYRDEPLPPLEDISALIVLGGAMGANDEACFPFLAGLKNLIAEVVAADTPYLGICLGGQLLAAALQAQVVSHRWEEVGMGSVALTEAGKSDALFRGMAFEFPVFQWHHDSFDIPCGGILLASSPACRNQAFRFGDSAWGVQFHPEVTEDIIRDWCVRDSTIAPETGDLVARFMAAAPEFRDIPRQMAHNFLRAAGLIQ